MNVDNIGGAMGGLGSHNVFAYCQNNPVMFSDPSGHFKQVGMTVYIDSKHIYDTYYSEKKNWIDGKTYVYDPGYKLYQKATKTYDKNTVSINNNIPCPNVEVTIDPLRPDKEDPSKINPNIHIEDSYLITKKADQTAVLKVIMESPEFDRAVFTRSLESYRREWKGHNTAHTFIPFKRENTKDVDLNEYPYKEDGLWPWLTLDFNTY